MTTPKKVRLACRRCRTRRIKCDGQVPACTNCAKAGQVCLDVDSQNSSLTIPRNFAGAAKARIEWLEDIIRQQLPNVNLNDGPRVDFYPETAAPTSDVVEGSASPASPSKRSSVKRPATAETPNDLQSGRAQSISMSLGMLSLNSDSSQKHYLGSSSGLLFADLIGASPSSDASLDVSTPISPPVDAGRAAEEAEMRHYESLHAVLAKQLPSRQDASKLVSVYVQWIHPDFPIFERESLLSAMDALYDALPFLPEGRPLPGGWPSTTPPFRWNGHMVDIRDATQEIVPLSNVAFILFMIFNIGAIVQVRSRVYEHPPDRFYRTAKKFAKDCFSQISLSSIQGEVLLMVHSMLTPGEMNLWTLLHIAWAHCVELGIHREAAHYTDKDLAYREARRRVFYTVYGLDRSISSIQGRPLGFRDETFDLKMPETQHHENPRQANSSTDAFDAAVWEYSRYSFEIDKLISEIKLLFYHLPEKTSRSEWSIWPKDPISHKERLQHSLHDVCLAFSYSTTLGNNRAIFVEKLKIKFHMALILLHQPSQVIRRPEADSLVKCYVSGCTVLRSYQRLSELKALHYGWREVQHIFAAGATVVYSFWTCEAVRQRDDVKDLSKELRTCSSLLTLGGEWWGSVKRGLEHFGAVADGTVQRVLVERGPSKVPRLSTDHWARFDGTRRDTVETGLLGADEPPLEDPRHQPHQTNLGTPISNNRDPWVDLYPDTEPQLSNGEFAPEIGSFLANFDNAEFTWSFPLNDLDGQFDLGGFGQNG